MGEVWLARVQRQGGFERFFALKVVLWHLAGDEKFREMFLDEARIASLVAHPNVASIVDTGEEEGTLYLAMEWVDGDSLQVLHRTLSSVGERIPLGVVLRVIADACAGLHAVHEVRDRSGKLLDVVHRDVSPHNILISAQGSAKLIDFGVAKAHDRIGATTGGDLKGKARYMAPEQANGHDVDRRADVWTIGAVLYFLLEGKAPFDAENDVAVLKLLLEGAPPRRPAAAVPSAVSDVVMRCLNAKPADRYATAADVQSALEEAMRVAELVTSAADVAAFVASKLGEHRTLRKAKREATLAAIERSGVAPAPVPMEGRAVPSTLSSAALPALPPPPKVSPLVRRLWAVYAVVAAALLIVAFVFLRPLRRHRAAPAAADVSFAPAVPPATRAATQIFPRSAAPPANASSSVGSPVPAPPEPATSLTPPPLVASAPASPSAPLPSPSASTAIAPAPRARTSSANAPPPKSPAANCRVPFFYDESGNKVFKKECF
jgi:eukaryotic-like serine/threonine-protein kinase